MAVRTQHLSNALQRCHLYLDRTQGNTKQSSFLLNQTRVFDNELAKCEDEYSSLELLREECKNRFEIRQQSSYEEPFVRMDSAIYKGLLSVRSEAGTGAIGELIRSIDDTDNIQKKQVTRVLVKDIVEKREISKLVIANCNASIAEWKRANAPPAPPPVLAPVAPPVAPPVAEVVKPKKPAEEADDAPPPVKKPKRVQVEEEDAPPPPPRRKPKRTDPEEEDEPVPVRPKRKPKQEVEDEEDPPPPPPKKKRKPDDESQ